MTRQLIIRRRGRSIAVIPCRRKYRCARRIAHKMARLGIPRWQIAWQLHIPRKAVDRYFAPAGEGRVFG